MTTKSRLVAMSAIAAVCQPSLGEEKAGGNSPSAVVEMQPSDEKAAIERFGKELSEVFKWANEDVTRRRAATPSNPIASMAGMIEVADRMKMIKTDSLPTDLKSAWEEYTAGMGELSALSKSVPKSVNPGDDFKHLVRVWPEVKAIRVKLDAAQKKVVELIRKHAVPIALPASK